MKSTGETTNTTEKEQETSVIRKSGAAPEKTEHILNRLLIGTGVCVAVIAVLIGIKLYRQDRQMDITEPFARSMVRLHLILFPQKNGFRRILFLPIFVSVRQAYH